MQCVHSANNVSVILNLSLSSTIMNSEYLLFGNEY